MTTTTMKPANAADELTVRTKATWMAGDFGKIAKSYESGAAYHTPQLSSRTNRCSMWPVALAISPSRHRAAVQR